MTVCWLLEEPSLGSSYFDAATLLDGLEVLITAAGFTGSAAPSSTSECLRVLFLPVTKGPFSDASTASTAALVAASSI